jgi:hypothetical protein
MTDSWWTLEQLSALFLAIQTPARLAPFSKEQTDNLSHFHFGSFPLPAFLSSSSCIERERETERETTEAGSCLAADNYVVGEGGSCQVGRCVWGKVEAYIKHKTKQLKQKTPRRVSQARSSASLKNHSESYKTGKLNKKYRLKLFCNKISGRYLCAS